MDNLNVLVEAKREYLGQLCLIMCPVMIEVFQDMYNEATKLSKGRKPLIMFQKVLKEVPNWSNQMSANHTSNIADRCAWFNDLLAAVFVACTKILSAVRLKTDNKKISLKLPTNEVFIQTCYNNVAKELYKDPYIFHDEQSEYVRDDQLTQRMSTCIEATVKELIPIQQILQTYMSQETRDIDLDGEVQDTEDPDVFDEPEEMPEAEPLPENEPMMGGEEQVQPTGLENEFKTVPGVQAPEPVMEPEMGMEPGLMSEVSAPPQATEEEDDGVLFGDAPDQRVKKTAYN
jgi:primosomal protein N''|tara:strand:- start:127 stop:990 length:864 start_codon:yes stop_codon:yes gene_type:complete